MKAPTGTMRPMSKTPLTVSILAMLLLAACQPGAEATEDDSTAPTPVEAAEGAAPDEMVCTSVSAAERESFLADSPFREVSEADWSRGAQDAAVTIVEYSDLQCPSCATLDPILQQLLANYPDAVRVVFRHFPLIGTEGQPIHPKAALAVQAVEAAGRQDAFWELHDWLFEHQAEWTDLDDEAWLAYLLNAATELGLDVVQFEADLSDPALEQLAEEAWDWGVEIGLPGTPFLLLNGLPYQWQGDYASLEAIVRLEMLAERQFTTCPEMIIDPDAEYTAILHTEKGDIALHLLPEAAPMAVNSFVFLAQNDWFDSVTFHRVVDGFMAQGGDPTGTGLGGPGYTFAIEVSSDWAFDRAGLLAMANSGPTANGSQFFLTLGAAEHLNGAYTIFGEVIDGMEVLENITVRNPAQGADLPPGDLILDVTIEEN